ncbi:MAG: bacillithiol biosynthesis deacetylase BshB1 [Flavobacteriales bacterium]
MVSKVNILALAAHPDDVELACSGILLKHKSQGKKTAVIDFTQGQLGSRGNAELRIEEARQAASILGLTERINLGWEDGFFEETEENLRKLIAAIRYFRPEVVLCNAPHDRHPDHGRAGKLAARACFLSGLAKIETTYNGHPQQQWRPQSVFHYIQDYWIEPDIVVDITNEFEVKMKSIRAFSSQFYNPLSPEQVETPISSKDFMAFVESRARSMGRLIGTTYAEGLVKDRAIGVDDLLVLK